MKKVEWNIPPSIPSLLPMEKGGKSVGYSVPFPLFFTSSLMVSLCQSAQKFDKANTHLVVPDLNQAVICTRDEIGLVSPAVIINAVHSFLVAFQSEVGWRGTKLPDLPKKNQTKTNSMWLSIFTVPKIQNMEFQRHGFIVIWRSSTTAEQITSPSPTNKQK